MARVRITKKIPKALSGLEMKMSAGLYGKGTNGNSQFRSSGTLEAGKISQQPTEVRNTLQPVAREGANLEAEKGETAIVNIDGIPAHFKIGGKRHSEGGTPLNLPDNSFIFSDTAKMKITDPIMLAQFGMVPKKSGYTPAEIAKKYDINKYRQILADPNTDDIDRKTAEMMISNYNMKLAKLSLLQESKKGFPQGIPVVAMPYISEMEMNPEEFTSTQAQTDEPDADMGVSRYGGLHKAQEGYNFNKDNETAEKFVASSDPRMSEFYDAFQAATKNPNITPTELNALADQMEAYDAPGLSWIHNSQQDRLQDLASRLRDRSKPNFNRQNNSVDLDTNYKKKEQETLSKANKLYRELILKKTKLDPHSSEYFKIIAALDDLAPKISGIVERYPYQKESRTSGATTVGAGPFTSGISETDIKNIPAKLYSPKDIANIDRMYSDLEAEKKKLSVLQPAKEKVKTAAEAASKNTVNYDNMSIEELQNLLKEN